MSSTPVKERSTSSRKPSKIGFTELLDELGWLAKTYAECSAATPPIPPKPSGSRRMDRIANDIFNLAMRTFVAESQAASLLTTHHAEESPPAVEESRMQDGPTSLNGTDAVKKRLRVEIPPNYISSLLAPVLSPLSIAEEYRDLPGTVRGIRNSVDICTSEIRQLKARLDQKEDTRVHPYVEEPKSPVVVELESELDDVKETLQDIRMRERLLRSQNDTLARQAERVRDACSLLLSAQFDDVSWKSVFDTGPSCLPQSHPLLRLRIGLACFLERLTNALKAFVKDGTWTAVTADELGDKYTVCDLHPLNSFQRMLQPFV
ncbi:hypothetical protein FRB90_002160 [Tulasnella sp. 427]|nr:hypothetical protein FRB90_002160 [Tulasnella sp. 427]